MFSPLLLVVILLRRYIAAKKTLDQPAVAWQFAQIKTSNLFDIVLNAARLRQKQRKAWEWMDRL